MSVTIIQREPQSWLPKGALEDGKLARQLEDIVSQWAENWFVADNRSCSFSDKGICDASDDHAFHGGWTCEGDALCLTVSNIGRRQIASRMLAININDHRLTTPDTRLIGKLTVPVIEDLIVRMAKFLQTPANSNRLSAIAFKGLFDRLYHLFSINFDTPGNCINLFVAQDQAFHVRRTMTKPMRLAPPFSARHEAIGAQCVDVGARIGVTQLSYAELYGLGVGDVVVLDRRLDEAVDLTIDGKTDSGIHCDVQDKNKKIELRLVGK